MAGTWMASEGVLGFLGSRLHPDQEVEVLLVGDARVQTKIISSFRTARTRLFKTM